MIFSLVEMATTDLSKERIFKRKKSVYYFYLLLFS